ncbi:MAG: hypothetical protein ACM3UU_02210 [Ignavibacteriales bacterium]
MEISKRANSLVRFFGTEFSGMEPKEGVEKLEGLISQYVKAEGKYTGVGVIEAKDIERWNYTLDIYKEISGIVFGLEKNYPNCNETISNFFDLKMVEAFLSAVILRGSKVFRDIEDKQKITLEEKKLFEGDNFVEQEHLSLIENFMKSPVPFIKENDTQQFFIGIPENTREVEKFFEKGQIVKWYLVYYLALVQKEKEILENKGIKVDLSKTEKRVKSMMNEFVQHNKAKSKER